MGREPTLASLPSATATTGVPKSAKRSLPWWAPVSARKEPKGPPMRVGPPTGNTKLRPISRVLYPAGLRGLGVALGFGVAVLVGAGVAVSVGVGAGEAPRRA